MSFLVAIARSVSCVAIPAEGSQVQFVDVDAVHAEVWPRSESTVLPGWSVNSLGGSTLPPGE